MACRRTRSQGELDRYVRLPDGTLAGGRTLPGRGAWICQDSPACLEDAVRKRVFGRALRGEVRVETLDRLRGNGADRARMVSSEQIRTGMDTERD